MNNRPGISEIFYFLNASEEVRKEVINGVIPQGYYTIEHSGEEVKRYYYQGEEYQGEGVFCFDREIGPNIQVYLS